MGAISLFRLLPNAAWESSKEDFKKADFSVDAFGTLHLSFEVHRKDPII